MQSFHTEMHLGVKANAITMVKMTWKKSKKEPEHKTITLDQGKTPGQDSLGR